MTGELTLAQVEAALRQAAKDVDRLVAKEVKVTAGLIRDEQRANVAVATGKTRDSIKATGPNGQPFTPTTTEAEIGPTWFVGRMIDLGTATQAPRPFVAASYEPHRAGHEARILNAAANALLKGLT